MVRWRTRGPRLLRVRTAVMAAGAAGMLAISLAGVGPASAANRPPSSSAPQTTTQDYTCIPQGEGISTCQWLRQTLEYQGSGYNRYNYDFKTWASMKGGNARREIIEIVLKWRDAPGGSAIGGRGTGIPVKSGSGTISGHLSKTLCAHHYYRPVFKFRYFEGSANKWIYGWSYGNWYTAPPYDPYCHGIGGVGH
jgi:hypothetical protein